MLTKEKGKSLFVLNLELTIHLVIIYTNNYNVIQVNKVTQESKKLKKKQ